MIIAFKNINGNTYGYPRKESIDLTSKKYKIKKDWYIHHLVTKNYVNGVENILFVRDEHQTFEIFRKVKC